MVFAIGSRHPRFIAVTRGEKHEASASVVTGTTGNCNMCPTTTMAAAASAATAYSSARRTIGILASSTSRTIPPPIPVTMPSTMAMSGAFCGGWIWRRVTDQLEHDGHKVFAPTLKGLAERSHLLSKDVNLDTHIADVGNLIKWESLRTSASWRGPLQAM